MRTQPQRKIGARELKAHLGKYMQAVRNGQTLIITERGEPVAEIRPLPSPEPSDIEGRLEAMEKAGRLTRGTGGPLQPFPRIKMKGRPMSETLIEDREDRF